MRTILVALFLTAYALAQRPVVDRLDPLDTGDTRLYQAIVTPEDDPTLKPNQRRIISAASPIWYADPETNELQPIEIGIEARRDAERNEDALGVSANTFDFMVAEDGSAVYTLAGHKLRIWLHEQKADSTGERARDETAQRPTALLDEGGGSIRIDGTMPGVTIRHVVGPGQVKEYVVIEAAPDTREAKSVRYSWGYESDLTPLLHDSGVRWSSADYTVFRFPAPTAWDAEDRPLSCRYELAVGAVSIVLDAGELANATYPITVDPTVTTDQGDATYNRSIGEQDYVPGDLWKRAFMLVALPDLTGFSSIDSALWKGRCQTDVGSGSGIAGVYCDVVGAWNESSTASTLLALSFNAATASAGVDADVSAGSWAEYDILGAAGVNGIAKVYGDDSSPEPATVMLLSDTDTFVDLISNIVRVGNTAESPGNGEGTLFYPRTDATNYWRVEITYTAGASAPNVSPSVGMVLGKAKAFTIGE